MVPECSRHGNRKATFPQSVWDGTNSIENLIAVTVSFGSEMDMKAKINTTFSPHICPHDEGKVMEMTSNTENKLFILLKQIVLEVALLKQTTCSFKYVSTIFEVATFLYSK